MSEDNSRNDVSSDVISGTVIQAGTFQGDVHHHDQRLRPTLIVVLIVIVIVVPIAVWLTRPVSRPEEPDLLLQQSIREECTYRFTGDGGVDGRTPTTLTITAQNRHDQEIVILGIRVHVHRRGPAPSTGELIAEGCAHSNQPVRHLLVDLDGENPRLEEPEPAPAPIPVPQAGVPSTAPRRESVFPNKVSRGDPEVFKVDLYSSKYDCEFSLVVDWVASGVQHQTTTRRYRIVPEVEALIARR